ncbi:MAG: methyltransferase domain-containing protein [Gemmatimonadota bacterium]|nr:methyltransferase domain-containing protein [Gemmatimonadota bacterium]
MEITTRPLLELLNDLQIPVHRVLIIRCAPRRLVLQGLEVLRAWKKGEGLEVSLFCHRGQDLEGCSSIIYPDPGFFRPEKVDPGLLGKSSFDLVLVPYASNRRLNPFYANVDRIAESAGAAGFIVFYPDGTALSIDNDLLELKFRTLVEPYERRKTEALEEISAFTGEDPAETEAKCEMAGLRACELWETAVPDAEAQVRAFYQQNDFYIYELMKTEFRGEQDELVANVLQEVRPGDTVCEAGGGCGTLAIALALAGAKVAFLDLPGPLLDFAAFRFLRKGLDIEIIPNSGKQPLGGLYDVITNIDVLEHMAEPEDFLRHIAEHVKPGGKLIIQVDWEEHPVSGSSLPLHLNRISRPRYRRITQEELGLEHLTSYGDLDVFRKPG